MNNPNLSFLSERAGLILCTCGSRELLINGELYHITRGVISVSSPLVKLYEISRTDDYSDIEIASETRVFYELMKSMFDIVITLRIRNKPCLLLDDAQMNVFEAIYNNLCEKRKLLESSNSDEERKILETMIKLTSQEALLEFLHLYLKNSVYNPVPISRNNAILFNFVASVHLNVKKERSVNFYAREANLSPGHFTRIIKENIGKSPSEWIAENVIFNAKLLLTQSSLSIKEIAAQLNFPEQFTFRKYFKHHTGLSPKEFRHLHSEAQ